MNCLLSIGTVFWNLSFWLWLLASLGCVFMLLRGYFLLSFLWHLPERMPKIRGSSLLKPGGSEVYLPQRSSTGWIQVAKSLILAAALLLAYDAGGRNNHSREYELWKQRSLEYQKKFSDYQQVYAVWRSHHTNKENR